MVQVQGSPYKKSNEGKEKGKQKVVDEDSGLQKADKGRGKEKVVDEGRGKEKVVDEGSGLQKPNKGKGKQNVVDEDSDSWSDEIFDDSDDNFEGLGEDVSDESDFDIETMLEDRTDDSDEGLSWISEEIKTPINSDNEEMDREEQMQHAGSTDHPPGAGEGSAAGPPQLSAIGPSEETIIEPAEVSDTGLDQNGNITTRAPKLRRNIKFGNPIRTHRMTEI
ncbi:hypothetical protein VNO77_00847 [Canavalia gladiata]|uniref:Uncharacterized protein n=1 Tax=Canavalia gladiata TaxID=3824 RepID=A0AAN9MQV4_CANGL